MAVGGGCELVGRVITRRDTAALRGAGEANGGPMAPLWSLYREPKTAQRVRMEGP